MDCLAAPQLLTCFCFFKIWFVFPFNTCILLFCSLLDFALYLYLYVYILSPLLGGNIVNVRQFVFYFTIPQSIVYHVLNQKHSINVCLTGKQEGKLRFQEGDCNITQNHIKESQ